MKKMWKKVSAVLLAFVMCIMTLPLTVAAANGDGTYVLKINTADGHTYKVYQLLIGDVSKAGDKLSDAEPGSNAGGQTVEQIEAALKNGENWKTGIDLSNAAKGLVSGAPFATVTGDGTTQTVKVEGKDVPGGYYVITDEYTNPDATNQTTTLSATMVEIMGDVTVEPKDSTVPVQPEKTVKKDGADVKTVSIGDTLTYTLKGQIPEMNGYETYRYELVDTMSVGLAPKDLPAQITVPLKKDGTETGKNAIFDVTTTSNTDGTTTIRFVLTNAITYKTEAASTFEFNYDAVVTKAARPSTEIKNSVKVEYSSNPDQSGQLGGNTIGTDVTVYTTELVINKVDGDHKPLTGAEFKLTGTGVNVGYVTGQKYVESETGTWYKLVNGAYTEKAPNADGTEDNQYESTTKKYALQTVNENQYTTRQTETQAFVGADGKVKFTGLGEGTYTLSEVTTPDGYNTINDITITITFNEATKTFTATTPNPKAGQDGEPDTLNVALNGYEVVNLTGSTLPSTGGIGTTIFYVVGGILVVAAVVLLVTKKRMSNRA